MEKVRYYEMLPHEIVKRRKEFPAAFIGLGTLEWHGEHLAVGNDSLKAEKLCEMAARSSGGFAFPTLWYGEPRVKDLLEYDHDPGGLIKEKMGFNNSKFTVTYFGNSDEEQIEFYKKLIYHMLIQMNTLEMKAVCLVCGHYPLRNFAEEAVKKFNKSFSDTHCYAGIECDYADPRNQDMAGGDHAAKWETSYLWYLRPDCVDLSIYLNRDDEQLLGIMGEDPRNTASIEVGRRGCNIIVDGMVSMAKQLMCEVEGP